VNPALQSESFRQFCVPAWGAVLAQPAIANSEARGKANRRMENRSGRSKAHDITARARPEKGHNRTMPRVRTAPRKLPQQQRSHDMVETILEATARLLVGAGYEATNTNRIAECAGISVGSLYQYFPNKEALVTALIARHVEQMWGVFEAAAARLFDEPVEVAARALIRMEIEAHAVAPALHKVLIEQVPRIGGLERLNEIDRRVTALVRAYLDAHKNELRVRDTGLAAFIVVHIVEGLAHAAVLEHPEYLAGGRLVEETTEVVLRYLVA
jgi:AcrR family transcriptional regulator